MLDPPTPSAEMGTRIFRAALPASRCLLALNMRSGRIITERGARPPGQVIGEMVGDPEHTLAASPPSRLVPWSLQVFYLEPPPSSKHHAAMEQFGPTDGHAAMRGPDATIPIRSRDGRPVAVELIWAAVDLLLSETLRTAPRRPRKGSVDDGVAWRLTTG